MRVTRQLTALHAQRSEPYLCIRFSLHVHPYVLDRVSRGFPTMLRTTLALPLKRTEWVRLRCIRQQLMSTMPRSSRRIRQERCTQM